MHELGTLSEHHLGHRVAEVGAGLVRAGKLLHQRRGRAAAQHHQQPRRARARRARRACRP